MNRTFPSIVVNADDVVGLFSRCWLGGGRCCRGSDCLGGCGFGRCRHRRLGVFIVVVQKRGGAGTLGGGDADGRVGRIGFGLGVKGDAVNLEEDRKKKSLSSCVFKGGDMAES